MNTTQQRPRAIIFLGPTMSVDAAREHLPDAIYLKPAGQGDLLSALINLRPQVIGLIDGVFLQSLSIWHKEILYAIEQGVHVFGSSSMGALRAAELDVYGMRGIGAIYRSYADGELMDDDEVALAHESGDDGFTKLSEPLVNLRATFALAHERGLIDAHWRERLVAAAKQLYFGDRVLPLILQRVVDDGMPAAQAEQLKDFCREHYVDLKARDAVELLQTIAGLPADLPAATPVVQTIRSPGFDTMYNRDRVVPVAGREVPLAAIANYAAIHDPGYADAHFNALNRFASVVLAKLVGIAAEPEHIDDEARRFRIRRGLEDDEAFSSWLSANHLGPSDFRVLMTELALCRRVHRWFLYARWSQRSTRIYLDQLRLEGGYEELAERTAMHERLLELGGSGDSFEDWMHKTDKLLTEHCSWTDVTLDTDAKTWAEDIGFHSKRDLKLELLRARAARLTLLQQLAARMGESELEADDAAQ